MESSALDIRHGGRRLRPRRRAAGPRPTSLAVLAALGAAALLVALAVIWVADTRTRPSYDAFGWLVWGREVVEHGTLNTDGAPSWKPLTFLFTLPYGLFGRGQLSLWTVTATTAAFSSAVFAARIAFRLAGGAGRAGGAMRGGERARLTAGAAALFAAVAVPAMNGYSHQVFIASSDPMVVALSLAAIDAHLSRRSQLAFGALVLASLGRPEAWSFTGLYALWAWRALPRGRWLLAAGLLLIPAAWFLIPGFTSHSWFVAGDLALKSPDALHHHQLSGVLHRFLGLNEIPIWVAAAAAVVLGLVRRDRVVLLLAAAAVVWVAEEVAFAYHGWAASARYVMEPGAVAAVLAGALVGRLLSGSALRGAAVSNGGGAVGNGGGAVGNGGGAVSNRGGAVSNGGGARPPHERAVRVAGAAGVLALLVALAPAASAHVTLLDQQISRAKRDATLIDRLQRSVDDVGGPAAILRCGHPVTTVGYQSTLGWLLTMNVGNVGYKPGREFRSNRPIVFFKPHDLGWTVRALHIPRRRLPSCSGMRLSLDTGLPLPPPPTPPARTAPLAGRLRGLAASPTAIRRVIVRVASAPAAHQRSRAAAPRHGAARHHRGRRGGRDRLSRGSSGSRRRPRARR